ncbi:MAG: acyl-CoA/acyl-ACP dehydrogenase [Burkholderiales bacterium]|nr:acyl-CoA/acyl-ACP dehydrogenase [Burkholderiales bacterium]MDE1928920.1 acyl-CoA/acyl-ACP dehydrogenase [Burkholderiales bacterium]MDE2160787.1 acyl-CoA/acyl-ACP dehydrogenase [Burkholderiales bacterium]MDE2505256.1 acyl-CoA/acyl-ACP dehydrogenase [Burkholderiales bacterium]
MTTTSPTPAPTASPAAARLQGLASIVAGTIAPAAAETDKLGRFPRAGIEALAAGGLLGLISDATVGGAGGGLADAAAAVRRIAQSCASTAMVLAMHYSAVAVIEQFGPVETRRAIAAGRHLSTLAFSEAGSRSHFWAPTSSARDDGDAVRLDAAKSWVTAAAEADSYVWSSRPLAASGASSLWLVASRAAGLTTVAPFDGLGLRGNASSPLRAEGLRIARDALLGADGAGFDIMMGVVLPWFSVLNAAASVGLIEGALGAACAHVTATRYAHLDSSIADLPTVRAYLARAKIQADSAALMLDDTVAAVAAQRADAMLRVLEVKAHAGETALAVTDTAMRVCGGAAFRKEVGVERHFRDARAASVMAPTSDMLYDFIGKAILGLPLF